MNFPDALAPMNRFLRIYPYALMLMLASVPAGRTAVAQVYDAYALADSVTVGERFQIVVSVRHDGSRTPVFPHEFLPDSLEGRPSFEVGGFTVLGNTPVARRRLDTGWVVDSLRYEVATFELDSAYVPMLPVGLAAASDTLLAATPPVLVRVKSLVPENAEGLRDITDLAGFPGIAWYWYVIPALILLGVAFWLWRRRRKVVIEVADEVMPEPDEPPWDEAERRLRSLELMDLSDPANVKPFYVELSDIFRTYVARRARIPAMESTTRELVFRLRQALLQGRVPNELVSEVEGILSQADLVKFADMKPETDVGRSSLSRTRSAIEGAEARYNDLARQIREAATANGNGTSVETDAGNDHGATLEEDAAIDHGKRVETVDRIGDGTADRRDESDYAPK